MSQHNEKYRPDIDGLRAIAVLSVLGFHAFPAALAGGFVGVDVFFVISGFLISEHIIGDLERGAFSFGGFYRRRIKRIFPALLLVLVAVYAFGWISLVGSEYRQLGKHIAGGAAFVSNLLLWRESGYFDNAAVTKPLLHLWSLGVEEQFYIFWPLILWFGARRKLNLLTVILAIAVVSFALNVMASGAHPAAAFYSPLTRFWELMLGASLAYMTLHPRHRLALFQATPADAQGGAAQASPRLLRNTAAGIGLLSLAAGLYLISEQRQFPGWWALLPTLGTLALIAAGPQAWLNRRLLSNPILVWFGLISYPLYLWHWPLFSYARIVQGSPPSLALRIMIVCASILLAWLTYVLVEKPIRFGKNSVAKTLALAAPMVLIAGIGIVTYAAGGLTFRSVVKNNIDMESGADGGWPHYMEDCSFIEPEDRELLTCKIDSRHEPSYALIGDSKAGALFPGLMRTAAPDRTWLYFGSSDSVTLFPITSQNRIYSGYQKKPVQVALAVIDGTRSVHTVVVATAARALFTLGRDDSLETLPTSKDYPIALDALDNTVALLLAHGKDVVLLMDNPTLPHKEDCIDRKTSVGFINRSVWKPSNPNCRLPIEAYRRLSQQYQDMLYEIQRRHPGRVRVFDPTDILCDEQSGLCLPTKNGRLMYGVSDHISDYASTLVGMQLNRFVASGGGS